jgi:putative SOS response-associated peptidase YedK
VCGRFVQTSSVERLAAHFQATDVTEGQLRARHNVAPSTPVPAIIDAGGRRLGLLRWGFVPSWSRSPEDGPRPINARVEGAATSRLFAPALARQRCVVPVDAWYEWTDEDGARQPWLLQPRSREPAAVAALWSTWRPRDGVPDDRPLATVALMTTEATGAAATIHHRMPLIVPDGLLDAWLDPTAPADATLAAALRTTVVELDVVRVSRRVNDVRNDGPDLMDPLPEQ